jgi:hypothetical protein
MLISAKTITSGLICKFTTVLLRKSVKREEDYVKENNEVQKTTHFVNIS